VVAAFAAWIAAAIATITSTFSRTSLRSTCWTRSGLPGVCPWQDRT